MENITKSRLVFFQRSSNQELPNFIRLHLQEHIKCLSHFFEVIVINEECDYQQICDKYQPDLTLFESGVYGGKQKIKNTFAYPEIPKIGFLNSDAYCISRAAFISDMESWGIETFFTLSVSMGEYTPEIADKLFVWPNFVDENLYRDYGESKIIPVFLTGSMAAHYPWRKRISEIVSRYYPSLTCPHFGWSGNQTTSRIIYGEQYARMLNSSYFVPTCGTIAKEVVRKHFEIPASKSCLITEKSLSLEAAGFVDMENCVFTDESDILDKLDYLFKNLDELEKITNSGYQLVHANHTLKQRNQIFQWYNLNKLLQPGQRIVQTNPFGPLTIVEETSGIKNSHIINHGLDRILLRQGDEKLWAGEYDEAESLYLRCVNYQAHIPEPKLRLTLCNLYKGNADTAIYWILQPIKETIENSKAVEPDPVEWAYFIVSLMCQGKLNEAIKRSNQFPFLCHPELERARLIINILQNKTYKEYKDSLLHSEKLHSEQSTYRYSLHQLPNRSLNEWINHICIMLKASKQFGLAERLNKYVDFEVQFVRARKNYSLNKEVSTQDKNSTNKNILKKIKSLKNKRLYPTRIATFQERIVFRMNYLGLTKLLPYLNFLETKFGYFLPYHISEMRNDDCFHTIQKLVSTEDIQTALIIGASAREGGTEAILAGIQENPNQPILFCMNRSKSGFVKLQKRYTNNNFIKCYAVAPFTDEIENSIKIIKQENNIDLFDVVFIDSSEFCVNFNLDKVYGARFVLLEDINTFQNHKNHHRLLADPNYTLNAQNLSLRNGYAIFKFLKL